MADLRVAYITFWGLDEGITHATVFPSLRILEQRNDIASVTLYTFERSASMQPRPGLTGFSGKVVHRPVRLRNAGNIADRVSEALGIVNNLLKHIRRSNTDLVVCRSSTAGVFGSIVSIIRGVPLVVESFEPHADYMADTGTWNRFGMKFMVQKCFEWVLKRHALALLTVSANYKHFLEAGGVRSDIHVAPCPVDMEKFRFSEPARALKRKELGLGETDIAGVYAGKFNDIYFSVEEAFRLFKAFREEFAGFKVIVLTQHPPGELASMAARYGFSEHDLVVKSVSHEEVSAYLSAADIGFCLVRPSRHRKYCCPIKTGEYWAAGLPVVIPEGIGDDSDIIQNTGLGIVLQDVGRIADTQALRSLMAQRSDPRIAGLAQEARSVRWTERAYERVLERYWQRVRG